MMSERPQPSDPTGNDPTGTDPTGPDAPPPGPFRLTIGAEAAGQRIDRVLAEAIGGLSRSRVKTLIDEGRLQRDGRAVMEPAEGAKEGAV